MRITSTRIALLISLSFVLLALNYAHVTPPFEASDEAAHFLYIHNLLEDGELPRIISREEIATQPGAVERWALENHQPPLYYTLGAVLIAWTERSDIEHYLRPNDLIFIRGMTRDNPNVWLHSPDDPGGDTDMAVWVLRLYSLALGTATLWFIYLAARQVFDQPSIPLLAMLFVASIPTFVSISASINNDNLVTMLYAAGVYWSLRMWRQQMITARDIIVVSVILAAAALTKITGLSLFAVVYLSLLVGVRRGHYASRRARMLVAVSLAVTAVVAGWWYARNWSLYGDPLALTATQSLWGREFEIAATSGDPLAELVRIGKSFWMMVGYLHFPVYGPDWIYVYSAGITLVGLIGAGIAYRRDPARRDAFLLMAAVCVVVAVTLLAGTRSVDISYGRLLFPALVGFAPLVVVGWRQVPGRVAGSALVLPLAFMALLMPARTLPQAYPPLARVEAVPDDARFIGAGAETLALLAYEVAEEAVSPSEEMLLRLYFRGQHPQNPALLVTAVDPITQARLGHVEVYPGMAPTDGLDPAQIYRAPVWLRVDSVVDDPLRPRQMRIRIQWHSPAAQRDIPLVDGAGTPLETLLLDGPALIDPRYEPPTPEYAAEVTYGDMIALEGYSLSDTQMEPGAQLDVTLHWRALARAERDWTVTAQLVDESGQLIAQDDGMPAGYPTSAWVEGMRFPDARTLAIPEDAQPGEYRVLVGWYRLEDFARLPALGEHVEHDLYALPQRIAVRE